MGYTPTFPNALYAKPLLNQTVAIIQRDQASAIAIVNPEMQPISEFHKGPGLRTAFPWLVLALTGERFNPDATLLRDSMATIALALDVATFDQEWAQERASDYARLLDMIVMSAGPQDWETSLPITLETVPSGMTTPNAAGSVKEVFVAAHSFSLVTTPQIETPVLRVTLSVVFHLSED
jgi:hypothetical protein